MADILVRKIPENVKRDLKRIAARNGKSLEGDLREVLIARARQVGTRVRKPAKGLGTMLVEAFKGKVPAEFKIPPRRKDPPDPAKFE